MFKNEEDRIDGCKKCDAGVESLILGGYGNEDFVACKACRTTWKDSPQEILLARQQRGKVLIASGEREKGEICKCGGVRVPIGVDEEERLVMKCGYCLV